MGVEANPARIILAVATAGTSEAIIHTAQGVGKIVPFPTTCCGCGTNYHRKLIGSENIYHCTNCDSHCGHIATVGWRWCQVCGEDVKFC